MNLSEREKLELLGRIGAAFWSVFPEADRVRTPAFEAEMRVFFVRIVADQEKIGELGASTDGYDRLMVDMLRGRVGALLNELVASIEHRGAYADRKYMQFMALVFPIFGEDFPVRPDPEARLIMDLVSRPGAVN